MHNQNAADQLIQKLRHLVAAHPEAVSMFGEIVAALCTLLDVSAVPTAKSERKGTALPAAGASKRIPDVDHHGFAIRWKGKTCFLGKTLAFKLFARLARCPNHFLSHEVLLDEVWKCHVSKEAMRSVVKSLKQKLRTAGMDDLAEAIDGTRRECYGLMIDR